MQDLIATREQLGRGHADASEEFRRALAIAGSSACDKAFIRREVASDRAQINPRIVAAR